MGHIPSQLAIACFRAFVHSLSRPQPNHHNTSLLQFVDSPRQPLYCITLVGSYCQLYHTRRPVPRPLPGRHFAHLIAFRAFDTPRKIRSVNAVSRICSARGLNFAYSPPMAPWLHSTADWTRPGRLSPCSTELLTDFLLRGLGLPNVPGEIWQDLARNSRDREGKH
jgi:hypothetical protein